MGIMKYEGLDEQQEASVIDVFNRFVRDQEKQIDIPFDGRPISPAPSQTESDDYCVIF